MIRLGFSLVFIVLIILATFTQIQVPFIALSEPTLFGMEMTHQWQFLTTGYYTTNLQIIAILLTALSLGLPWALFTTLLYLLLGLAGFPIFYYGGGTEYIFQDTSGYILSFLPAVLLCQMYIKKHSGWLYMLTGSILGLLLIHVIGSLYLSVRFQAVPIEFIMTHVVPQLPWQITVLAFCSFFLSANQSLKQWVQKRLQPPTNSKRSEAT